MKPRKKKIKKIKAKAEGIDFSLPYSGASGKSKSREVANRMYDSKATKEERGMGSVLSQDSEGNYTRKTKLESKAKKGMKVSKSYKEGGSVKDACYHKVKAGEKVFPSAYASGRIAKCRKMGAANYGKGKK